MFSKKIIFIKSGVQRLPDSVLAENRWNSTHNVHRNRLISFFFFLQNIPGQNLPKSLQHQYSENSALTLRFTGSLSLATTKTGLTLRKSFGEELTTTTL